MVRSYLGTEEKIGGFQHDDLAGCFSKLMLMLRQGLSLVMEDHVLCDLHRSGHQTAL